MQRRPNDRDRTNGHSGLSVGQPVGLSVGERPFDRPHPPARSEDLALHRGDPLLGLGRLLLGGAQPRRECRLLQRPLVVLTAKTHAQFRDEDRRICRRVTARRTPITIGAGHLGAGHLGAARPRRGPAGRDRGAACPVVRHGLLGRARHDVAGGEGAARLLGLATHRADQEHPGQQHTDDKRRRDEHQDLAGKVEHERSASFPRCAPSRSTPVRVTASDVVRGYDDQYQGLPRVRRAHP